MEVILGCLATIKMCYSLIDMQRKPVHEAQAFHPTAKDLTRDVVGHDGRCHQEKNKLPLVMSLSYT